MDRSLKIIIVQGGETHTKTRKQTQKKTINLEGSAMIKIGEDWPGLKIGTLKTFHENESKVTRVIHSAPEVEPK